MKTLTTRLLPAFLPLVLMAAPSLTFAKTGAGQGGSDQLAEVLALTEKLFAGKVLQGDDGIVQRFGAFEHAGSMHWVEVDVTLADGQNLHVVDTLVEAEGKALLIESISGGATENLKIRITKSGSLLVEPLTAPASGFLARECRSSKSQKTVCEKRLRSEAGLLSTVTYRELAH